MSFESLLDPASVRAAADATNEAEAELTPGTQAQALTGVLSILGDSLGVPVIALTRANVTSSMQLDVRDRVDHLARIEEERGAAVARAEAVLAARRFINAAYAKLGSDLRFYDIEDGAWDIAVEDRDAEALAAQRRVALDELREDEDEDDEVERAGDAPGVIAVHARYDLASHLGEVLRELQKTEQGDLDEIVSDLRDRLSNDGETIQDAKRDLARTINRYRIATAVRMAVEAYGRLVKKHVSAWPPGERDTEEEAVRAIVFGEED